FAFVFCSHAPSSDIYTLSLHDALPIFGDHQVAICIQLKTAVDFGVVQGRGQVFEPGDKLLIAADGLTGGENGGGDGVLPRFAVRSEEHTSELQSRENLVCRLLLEKKKK